MRQNILLQLFDIRPTRASGEVDVGRINAVTPIVDLGGQKKNPAVFSAVPISPEPPVATLAVYTVPRPVTVLATRREPAAKRSHIVKEEPRTKPTRDEREIALRATFREALARVEEKDQEHAAKFRFRHAVVDVARPLYAEKRPRAPRRKKTVLAAYAVEPSIPLSPLSPPPFRGFHIANPRKIVSEVVPAGPMAVKPIVFSGELPPSGAGRKTVRAVLVVAIGILFVSGALGLVGFLRKERDGVFGRAEAAFSHVKEGMRGLESGQWQTARAEFTDAASLLGSVHQQIQKLGFALVVQAQSEHEERFARAFLALGQTVAEMGLMLANAGESFSASGTWRSIFVPEHSGILLGEFRKAETYLRRAEELANALRETMLSVDDAALKPSYRKKFFALRDGLPRLEEFIEGGLAFLPVARSLVGEDKPRKYLLLLENSSELRPTGGFPGTYGLIEFEAGRLKNFFLDGIYNPDGQLPIEVMPPKALQRVSPFWSMRDAGWFFDFPTSARKFAWFYGVSGGPAVDGVIAITPRFIERLLALTGSFSMPQYGQERIHKDNFIEVLQFEVEADFDPKAGNPKKILSDLAPQFLARVADFTPQRSRAAVQAVKTSLKERDVQVYFFDEKIQKVFDREDWSGRIKSVGENTDYLAVVHANVAGGKADWVTDDEWLQEIEIAPDGGITKTVMVTRRHQGGGTPYVWWNAPNKDYLRLLVPRGSTVLAATGFSQREAFSRTPKRKTLTIDPDLLLLEGTVGHDRARALDLFREHDKDAVAGWLLIPPGESRTATVRYALASPLARDGNFNVLVQKQAGLKALPVTTRIIFPDAWEVSGYPAGARVRKGLLEITEPLVKDLEYSFNFVGP